MKKILSCLLAGLMTAALLGGCGASSTSSEPAPETTAEAAAETTAETAETTAEPKETTAETAETESSQEKISVRVGSLKGPTSLGMVYLMEEAEAGTASNDYTFTMVTAADELLPQVINGNLDIALIPANVAGTLYSKTKGQISVIDINTLGVLYMVSSDDSIQDLSDLAGRTVYMTGKGTTPDYVFRYLLGANGMSEEDLTLEYKSESAEVAALLKEQPDSIGILPQPFVTVACAQNDSLKIVLDLTEEWNAVQEESGSQLVTGVTVVRNEFLEANPEAVEAFLAGHEESAAKVNENPADAAQLVVKTGIIENAGIAEKALPYCNITCITGEEMKAALSGYLQVLFDQDPASIGGALPDDAFYYGASGQ